MMEKAIVAGLAAGYLLTCAQLTPGYGYKLADMRGTWREAVTQATQAAESRGNTKQAKAVKSLRQLTDCGWCASPIFGGVAWLLLARDTGLRGLLVSVSVCAMYRHKAGCSATLGAL